MSFIIENIILFGAVEWGIIDPVDKSACDNLKVGNPWDNKWFHKFHNAVDCPACIVFGLFPKRSIKLDKPGLCFKGHGRQFRYFINLKSLTQDDEENGTR